MHFTINVVEQGATPDAFIVRGALTAHMSVLVDASNDTVSATVKPSDAGIQCDATKAAVAAAVANAIKLAGVANVQRLERQGIPVESPVRKPARVSAVSPDTEPDEDGPTIGPDVTGDVALTAAEPAAASVQIASTVSPEPQSSVRPTKPASPAVSVPLPGKPAAVVVAG